MGTITGYGSKHSHEFKLTVNETSTSTANNTSEISFSFTIYKASYSWSNWNSITYSISINGTSYSGTIPSYSAGSTLTIRTGSQTIAHNNDGTKTISYSFLVNDGSGQSYTCGNANASGSMDLTTIPRYANLTSLSVKSKTINSITLSYTTDRAAWLFVNLNNGESWLNGGEPFVSNTTSGEFTIYYKDKASTKRLDTNTSYTITVLCRALSRDSSLDTSKNISVATYDIAKLTAIPNINIGSSHTVTWANPSGASISLKLCKTDNSSIIDYGTVTGTSKAITPTASTIYALTPNSNTYTARYIITTTVNGNSYTNSKDFTFTVTNSNPTFSNFTYQDINTTITALTGNKQILVDGYSNVKATISTVNKATAKNSATIKSYKLLIGTKNTTANYNASANVDMSINQVDNNVIDLYAIDSRGNSTKVSKTATIKNYSNIKITSLSATRENNVGTTTTLKFEGEFWNASFGSVTNTITSCKYKYKTTSSSTWSDGKTTLTYTISENKITGSLNIQGDVGTDGFSVANSFDIQLILADKLSSATYSIVLPSGNPAIAIYKNNVAIGQQYDTSDGSKLQVNGDIKANFFKGTADYASNYRGLSTDLDTATKIGWYRYNKETSNIPSYISHWGAVVVQNDGSWIFQTAYATYSTDARIAHRGYVNGTWTSWSYVMQGANKTLYDNSSGTNGTVTLSETAANFNYLEIFYKLVSSSVGYFASVKIYSPNGKKISLTSTKAGETVLILGSANKEISGTSITNVYNGTYTSFGGPAATNEVSIYRVIGYR